ALALFHPYGHQPHGASGPLHADDPRGPGARRGRPRCLQDADEREISMTGRLENRAALIIGAARGIGRGVAERFAEEGARVVIADVEAGPAQEAAAALGGQFVATDISDPEQVTRAVDETIRHFGSIDIVVQNAGIYPWTLIEDTAPEEWDAVL